MQHDDTVAMLGGTATDTITGYSGVIINVAYHVTGCERIGLRSDDPSEAEETRWFYPTQLTFGDDIRDDVYEDDPVTSVGFDIGWHLRDRVTGAEGIATTITFSLHNCPEVALTPIQDDPPEEPVDRFWFDAPRTEVVNRPSGEGFMASLSAWVESLRNAGEGETGAAPTNASTQRHSSR
jgi:hypothetical protein